MCLRRLVAREGDWIDQINQTQTLLPMSPNRRIPHQVKKEAHELCSLSDSYDLNFMEDEQLGDR